MTQHHPLAQMLGALAAQHDQEYTLPQKEAQRDVLDGLLEATSEPQRFKRGDYVRYLAGSGPLTKTASEGLVLMFWRYLDPDAWADRLRCKRANDVETQVLPAWDCLLAVYIGQCIKFYVSASELLGLDTTT